MICYINAETVNVNENFVMKKFSKMVVNVLHVEGLYCLSVKIADAIYIHLQKYIFREKMMSIGKR